MLKQLNRNKKKKGFTLIELVIVLAVLAIIALIAIPNFTKVREDSQVKSDLRSLESIAKVIEMEIIDENISDTDSGTILVEFDAAGVRSVDLKGLDTTPRNAQHIIDALNKVNRPQAKGKNDYSITLDNGAISIMTTVA